MGITTTDELVPIVIDGRYEVDRILSRSHRTVSLLARRMDLHQTVVVKLLKSPDEAESFRREAVATAAVSHPNVVEVYGSNFGPDRAAYVAMEYIEGGSLEDLVAQAPLEAQRAANVVRQVTAAVAAGHAAGSAHGQLEKAAIFVSRRDGHGEFVTVTGFAIPASSPGPTQARARVEDVRAIGRLAYRLLTGRSAGATFHWPAEVDVPDAVRDTVAAMLGTFGPTPTASRALEMWTALRPARRGGSRLRVLPSRPPSSRRSVSTTPGPPKLVATTPTRQPKTTPLRSQLGQQLDAAGARPVVKARRDASAAGVQGFPRIVGRGLLAVKRDETAMLWVHRATLDRLSCSVFTGRPIHPGQDLVMTFAAPEGGRTVVEGRVLSVFGQERAVSIEVAVDAASNSTLAYALLLRRWNSRKAGTGE